MTLVADVKTRIGAHVADLAGRLGEAADLAALIKEGALPQQQTFAYVLPLGLDGGVPDAITGVFRQSYSESVGIVLVRQAPGDATGKAALVSIDALISDVIDAICGWSPPGETTGAVFAMRRGRLLPMAAGAVFYQLEFSLQRLLRI